MIYRLLSNIEKYPFKMYPVQEFSPSMYTRTELTATTDRRIFSTTVYLNIGNPPNRKGDSSHIIYSSHDKIYSDRLNEGCRTTKT